MPKKTVKKKVIKKVRPIKKQRGGDLFSYLSAHLFDLLSKFAPKKKK